MNQPVLSDKSQFPSEEVILPCIGKTKTLWQSFFDCPHTEHPEFAEEWRYYNDGKIRGLTVEFRNKQHLEEAKALLALKLSIR